MIKLVSDDSPCFNINLIRLGSAPPYRCSSSTTNIKTNLLPKLFNDMPPTSKILASEQRRMKHRKNTSKNKEEKTKVETFSELVKTTNVQSYVNRHCLEDTKELDRLFRRKQDFRKSNYHYEKSSDRSIDKLKIAGIGLGNLGAITPVVSPSKDSIDILPYSTSKPIFPYPNKHCIIKTDLNSVSSPKTLTSRKTLDQKDLQRETNCMSINEHLKIENARYTTEEKLVKKVLFQKWLKNLQRHIGKFQPVDLDLMLEPSESDSNEKSSS